MTSGPTMLTPSVCPSGAALATAAVPVLPPAPALFSTTKATPSRCCSPSATMRARLSGVDPAMNGTMMVTVWEGHSCAASGLYPATRIKRTSRLRIASSSPELPVPCARIMRSALPLTRPRPAAPLGWTGGWRQGTAGYLPRFAYDTIAHSKPIMEFVISMVGADRVMIGSDFCFDMGYEQPVGFVEELNLSAAERNMILGTTAAKLLKLDGKAAG